MRNQLRQRGRHHIAAKAEAGGHPQQAARLAARHIHLLQQMLDLVQNALRPVVDALALLRDSDPPCSAMQQLHAQLLLQQADALADKGRRSIVRGRSLGKAGFAHHGGEDAQVFGRGHFLHDL